MDERLFGIEIVEDYKIEQKRQEKEQKKGKFTTKQVRDQMIRIDAKADAKGVLTVSVRGIKVNAMAPGLRRTDLNDRAAISDGDPAEAAAGAVRLAPLPDDAPTGEFVSWDGTPVPW